MWKCKLKRRMRTIPSQKGGMAHVSRNMAEHAYASFNQRTPVARTQVASLAVHQAIVPVSLTTKPVVETYSSTSATIVEVPSESAGDAKIVMVIDDKLPADL